MKALYKQLYESCNTRFKCNNAYIGLEALAAFSPIKGSLFDSSSVRLLVVGRAANGWYRNPDEFVNADSFSEAFSQKYKTVGFSWLDVDESGRAYSIDTVDAYGKAQYYINSSAFWRTAEAIWRSLTNSNEVKWYEHIAWSNLYKISPQDGGNPTTTMCKKQLPICKQMLDKEIFDYDPTHILIVSGPNWWNDFAEFFSAENIVTGSDIYEYVLTAGYYNSGNKKVPTVVTYRPENKKNKSFIEAVLTSFSALPERK